MEKPVQEQYGAHTIKAGAMHGKAVARAFVTSGKPGVVAEAEGDTVDDAIAALKADLDARDAGVAADRRHDPALDFDVPTEGEYAQALAVMKPHGAHWKILRAHALAGEKGLTVKALTFDAGYHDQTATLQQMGIIADQIAGALGVPLPKTPPLSGADPAVSLIATVPGGAEWVMHPELRAAVLAHKT